MCILYLNMIRKEYLDFVEPFVELIITVNPKKALKFSSLFARDKEILYGTQNRENQMECRNS